MTATSTTNLITAVNRVLRDVGERQVSVISSPVSLKAQDYLRDAVRDLMLSNDWEWQRDRITAQSWANESAFLGTLVRVRGVAWGADSTGYLDIPWEPERNFDLKALQAYDSTQTSLRPTSYTWRQYNQVRLNPYPTDSASRAQVVFYVVRDLTPPTNATDFFPVPEDMMPILLKRALYLMQVRHLDDQQAAGVLDKEFKEMLNLARQKYIAAPTGGYNMYQRRFRRVL